MYDRLYGQQQEMSLIVEAIVVVFALWREPQNFA
jgi:hypothetical protein